MARSATGHLCSVVKNGRKRPLPPCSQILGPRASVTLVVFILLGMALQDQMVRVWLEMEWLERLACCHGQVQELA